MGRKDFSLVVCAIGVLVVLLGFAGNAQAQCSSDADCEDGLFCTRDQCIGGTCGVITACPPFIDGCVTRAGYCDEDNDVCVDVPDDSFCDAGQICDVTTGNCLDVTFCAMAQQAAQDAVANGGSFKNHGQMVKTAAQAANPYLYDGTITEECHSCIVNQFARQIPVEEQEACGPVAVECPCFDASDIEGQGIDYDAQVLYANPYLSMCIDEPDLVWLAGCREEVCYEETEWVAYVSNVIDGNCSNPPCCGLYDSYVIDKNYEGLSNEQAQACIAVILNSYMWELNCLGD